jgi:predicted acyl esterase
MKSFNIEVPTIQLSEPRAGDGSGWAPLNPRTKTLPKGWKGTRSEGIKDDILVEHDVAITVRDGVKLYADDFRPTNAPARSTPVLICWSPFGKKFNGVDSLKLTTPWNLSIPDGTLSGLEKFEAPDPAEWCPRGYAIVNVDSRGAFDSEGVMAIMGTQEAEDGYDTIEFLAFGATVR